MEIDVQRLFKSLHANGVSRKEIAQWQGVTTDRTLREYIARGRMPQSLYLLLKLVEENPKLAKKVRILLKRLPLEGLIRQDGAICDDCARGNGAIWPEGHLATFWPGTCSVCGEEKSCCAVSDWLWSWYRGKACPREF